MNYQHIEVSRPEDRLALVTVSREKALNALNREVLSELNHAFAELELDDAISVVALTGAGDKAFVAGADIAAMRDMGPREAQAFAELGGALCETIERSPMPFIAAVNGFALGGGCELALACDFIYASGSARFGQPEVKLGVIPGFGGTQRLARRVGIAKAKELIFTGDMISAEEALRIRLVDAVVDQVELMDLVAKTAGKISRNGPLAVAEAKRVINDGQSMVLEHGNELERRVFAGLFATSDQSEGMAAFVDKRTPNFEGR